MLKHNIYKGFYRRESGKMARTQRRSRLKPTGSAYKKDRKKKVFELGQEPTQTKIGDKRVKVKRAKGGAKKFTLLNVDNVNLYDPKEKKYSQEKIKTIVENTANRHFVRRNILTKGAVIETEKGRAKVTSRPGQNGSVSAVLIPAEKKKP